MGIDDFFGQKGDNINTFVPSLIRLTEFAVLVYAMYYVFTVVYPGSRFLWYFA